MKKAAQAVPNYRLKEARELRGWSQKYVAEQIGADHYYLSRWERGTAVPSPYYRSKLCALFQMDAKALGLVPEAPPEQAEEQKAPETAPEETSAPAPAAVRDPAIPPLLVQPEDLIGRDALLPQLRAYLCVDKEPGMIALYGLPGVGKTTLAVALSHDRAIQQHFQGGILWAGLGPQPDIPGLLSRWGALLGVTESESQKLRTTEAWIRRLRAAIGERQMLLVIDDAWEIEQALAFKVGGPGCAYLVTTRFPGLALQFAGSGATQIKELSDQDGVRLLARLAPQVVTDEPKIAQSLAQSVGGLPLALTLIGNYLRIQAHSGQPRRLRAAIERLRTDEERLRLAGPQALLERSPGLPEGVPVSLQAVIEMSEQQLTPAAREALHALSVFPAKPNSFSEEAALAVCQTSEETLDALSDAGLLESHGPGRYTLHQTIADYARVHLSDPAALTRLAEYFAHYLEEHERDSEQIDQEVNNIFAALEAAHTSGLDLALVRAMNAFFHFFFSGGRYSQEGRDYLVRAVEAARRLDDDALLAATLLHQAKVVYNLGQHAQAQEYAQEAQERARRIGDAYLLSEILSLLGTLARFRTSLDLAETYFQESLKLARQANDLKQVSDILSRIGSVLSDKGRYVEAEAYQQEALAIARSIDDRKGMTALFLNLFSMALMRGEFASGEAYGQEALALARETGYLDAACATLTNLGSAALDQGDAAKAEAYLIEALSLARQVGDAKLASVDVATLGTVAVRQERYHQAAAYFQEALQMARQIGDNWLLGAVLAEYGELALKQQRFDEAFEAFQEGLSISAQGSQEAVASSLYGLAQVAAARGNPLEARQQGEESLRLFEAMSHRLTDTVKTWLQSIPNDDNGISLPAGGPDV
jgi:tetratricopeptide (TPR) repeat protein/transcriptional regulator with XRE-family HTH domain